MQLLQESLFGVDINLTACRITAFSLYLAYLDRLSPPDIQANFRKKGRALPHLVVPQDDTTADPTQGNIRQADFFADDKSASQMMHPLVVGNPPWGSIAKDDTPAGLWCAAHARPLPDKQIAAAFIWKATEHVAASGRVCFRAAPRSIIQPQHNRSALPEGMGTRSFYRSCFELGRLSTISLREGRPPGARCKLPQTCSFWRGFPPYPILGTESRLDGDEGRSHHHRSTRSHNIDGRPSASRP